MRRATKRLTIPVVLTVLLASAVEITNSAGPVQARAIDDPTAPDVAIVSPDNSDCEPWDFQKSREENETVPCPWFPSIAELPNGDLYVAYSWSVSHSHSGSIAARRSTDGGQTWSEQQILVEESDPATVDVKEPNLTVLDDGTLLMSYWDYAPSRPNRRQVYVTRSADNGATWSAPVVPDTLMYDANRGSVSTNGEMVQLDNGDLLLPIYGLRAYDGSLGYTAAHVLRSRDGGLTWDRADERIVMWSGPVYVRDETIGYAEPALADLGGGHLMMVARTQNNGDVARVSHSYDHGDTWTEPVDEATLKAHAPHLLRLNDGSHLLTYGDRSAAWGGGRPVAGRLYIHSQGWSATESKLIYRNSRGFGDMSYPGSVQLDDGRILTVYYDRGEGVLGGTYTRPEDFRTTETVCEPVQAIHPAPPADATTLDLPGLAAAGALSVDTDMTWTAVSRPGVGVLGAIDGSHDYWHSTIADHSAPPSTYYTLTLPESQTVTAVGLTLKPGYHESAEVYLSSNGVDWDCPVAAVEQQRTDAPVWLHVGSAVEARHVKIVVSRSEGWATLAELQLATTPPGPCQQPDQRETVVIRQTDSGVPNRANDDGCTINNLIDDDISWATHGAFIKHVGYVTAELLTTGVVDSRERAAILRAASHTNIGRPHPAAS